MNEQKQEKKVWRGTVLLFLTLLVAVPSFAADQSPRIELKIKGEKEVVTVRDGKHVVESMPLDKVRSGDVLVYTVIYTNSGDDTAKDVKVVDAIPVNTVYIPGSAAGKNTNIRFSIDGGVTYLEPPVMQKIRDKSGKEIIRPAPPELYTHIQWVIHVPVNPKATGTTTFKVSVK